MLVIEMIVIKGLIKYFFMYFCKTFVIIVQYIQVFICNTVQNRELGKRKNSMLN